MPVAVILPKFTDMGDESVIASWLVREGDHVLKGDPICEVETDKVNMEVEAPENGRIARILYAEGEAAPITGVIAYILKEGESEADLPPQQVSASPLARRVAAAEQVDLGGVTGSGPRGRITRADVEARVRATPAARHVAREKQLDLTSISGSGPRGRIQRADVEAVTSNGRPVEMTAMRRSIAARMQSSWQTAPHIFFEVAVDGTRVNGLREVAKKREQRLSVTAILIKACAWTLMKHPNLNATFENDALTTFPHANIGMAVALDGGLIVPTIRRAESLSLSEIQVQVDDLTARAHAGKLRLDDLAEGTFTVSNLGMRGVDRFTAIINPPQVAILAVGRMVRQFVPDENDQPVVRPMMTLTLSVDHRVVDGADAAAFLEDLSAVLEEPGLLAW